MYDHIGLKVQDLASAKRFYEAALKALGHVPGPADSSGASFGPPGEPALWLYAAEGLRRNGVHIAFRAPDRKAVDRFHAMGVDAGGRDNGEPGLRADYGPKYYAAFLLDPDGNNVEAVCLK